MIRLWNVLGGWLLLAGSITAAYAQENRPNFLVILCDDLGYGDLGCFGHPHIKTKNLDRLSAQGIRLTNCYSAAPVCSPSRVGLLTGRSPNRAGIYDWIPEAGANTNPNQAKNSRQLVHMRDQEVTLPKLLKQSGYATAMAGKWHCNSMFNRPEQPQPGDAGFDHWLATQNNAAPSHENPTNFVRNGQPVGALQGFSCQIVADEAIRWLESRNQTAPTQPFFLYVAFHEPHEPIQSPTDLVALYRQVARNEDEAQHFANVHNMDLAVGRLLNSLEKLNLTSNTLVYFSSDNGPETLNRYKTAHRSYGSPGVLRGMKLWTTEAGFRVPGIVRWPAGQVGLEGHVLETPISSLDLLPTFCELANAKIPSELVLDGMDVVDILKGHSTDRTKPLFWFYYNALNEQRAAMRDGNWKVLAKFNHGRLPKYENVSEVNFEAVRAATLTDFELYDMNSDPGESHNLSQQQPQLMDRLSKKMNAIYGELLSSMHVWPRMSQ